MSARRSKRNTRISPRTSPRRGRLLEGLEPRLMFSSVVTDSDPLTSTPETVTFEYKDFKGTAVRVTVHGDVSAEFVFARITEGSDDSPFGWNDVILGEPVAASNQDEDGRDLFHVYVAQASIDSYISIAQVPSTTTTGPRPMQPYSGSVSLTISPIRGDDLGKSTAGGTGSIYLGARTREVPDVDDSGDRPIRSDNFNGQGIFPAPAKGRLVAGMSTAPGVSIGKFMFGGAVSGNVTIDGSIETFYCGALLTGVTEGQGESSPLAPNNFHVSGDMRNLLVKGSIGTDGVGSAVDAREAPTYLTGVDIDVKGRVGQIRTGDDYIGFATIENNLPTLGLRTRQQEVEYRIDPGVNRGSYTEFQNGQFGDNQSFYNNDTFADAQFLGSINSKQTGNNSVQVNGLLQWAPRVLDQADYYAVPLMAGQSVNVRLLSTIQITNTILRNGQLVQVVTEEKSPLHVGVFDPDARLIASDFSNNPATTSQTTDLDSAQQELFNFTADRPGIYRFAVGLDGPGFGAAPGPFIGEQTYQLQITGVGNLGLGGLVAAQTILAIPGSPGANENTITGVLANAEVVYGDLGAIFSQNDFIISNFGVTGLADGGEFRAIDAMSLGQVEGGNTYTQDIIIAALTGSVGMIRARGTDAGTHSTHFNAFGRTQAIPIGGDIQYIVAPNVLITDASVNGSVGVVQAAQWGVTTYAGSLSVNADGIGKPGVIDLIDVTGNMGSLQTGGPTISTNTGGNVRNMRVGGTAYRPSLFGGSLPEETTYVKGQSADITDDSGAQVHIEPTHQFQIDPITGGQVLDPITGEAIDLSGTLTVLTYPIARSVTNTGGGGVVLLKVTSTRGVEIRTTGGSAEIGEIVSTGSGPALTPDFGPDGIPNSGDEDLGPDGIANSGDEPFGIDPNNLIDNSVELQGALTDVYMVRGSNFNKITNSTGGEISNISAGQVGEIRSANLGTARSSIRPGMATEGVTVADNPGTSEVEGAIFPFNNAKNAIVLNAGSTSGFAVGKILATQAIGNVMVNGILGELKANSDNVGVKGVVEGILGAVYTKGQVRSINVGEGLLPSGTGNMGKAGIYAAGRIERVVNQSGSDIRGDIVSNIGIGDIVVNGGGSIINADIEVIQAATPTGNGADMAPSAEFGGIAVIVQGTNVGNIDSISVDGNGGIIGLLTRSNNLGPVKATNGFGIINMTSTILGNGRFDSFTADGYGLRGVNLVGGQSVNSILANGDGNRLKTTAFSAGLRLSETLAIDPFFGTKPNHMTDLHVVIGTTKDAPTRKGTSASGSIDLSSLRVSRDVGSIKANTMRAALFNVGNNIGSITVDSYSDTLEVTAGKLTSLTIGKDALRTDFAISGPVNSVYVGGSFKGTSKFAAGGPNGSIGTFTTGRSLYGNVSAAQGINSIRVGTVYGSQGTHAGGSLSQFITNGDFVSGAILDVNKTLSKLVIGGSFQDGATVKAGVLGTTTIIGDNLGDIVIG